MFDVAEAGSAEAVGATATETAAPGTASGAPQFEQNFPAAGLPHSEQYMTSHFLVFGLPDLRRGRSPAPASAPSRNF
jgi:hypothetical protein